jgi:hypothetical protein
MEAKERERKRMMAVRPVSISLIYSGISGRPDTTAKAGER